MTFIPKSIVCLREGYTREQVMRDLIAGVVVGIVALPLGLAFAIASGVPPERGLYTAIFAGFIISAFGGSRVQIGGPTGAFVVIVYGIVATHGYEGLVVSTIIAGFILIALGLARLGTFIKFIPYPVVTGFTAGIAVVIFSSQMKDFFGLQMGTVPVHFVDKWVAYGRAAASFDPATAMIAIGSVITLVLLPKVTSKVPAPFVVMIAATAVVQIFDLPVETIGSRFGGVPTGLPRPHLPSVSMQTFADLVSPSITIALLAAIESLLSAVVADGMIGTRHKSNVELIAQGMANVVSPIFGGIPATGAIARTATNIRSGGRTPLAGIVHALTLLVIVLFFSNWASLVPLAALAAILVVVAYHMSEWHSFVSLFRAPRGDVFVLLLTFILTVFIDLTVAVQVGIVVASLLFMQRMSEMTHIAGVGKESVKEEDAGEISRIRGNKRVVEGHEIPKGVDVYEVHGPFFFGVADKMRDVIGEISKQPKTLIVRMRNVPTIDATGLHALEQLHRSASRAGTRVILCEMTGQPLRALIRSRKLALFGRQNIARSLKVALEAAREGASVQR